MASITIEHDDGTAETIPASECLILRSDCGEPRDLIALRRVLQVLEPLSPREAHRVLAWAADSINE